MGETEQPESVSIQETIAHIAQCHGPGRLRWKREHPGWLRADVRSGLMEVNPFHYTVDSLYNFYEDTIALLVAKLAGGKRATTWDVFEAFRITDIDRPRSTIDAWKIARRIRANFRATEAKHFG
jgi:hypothetical protein